ncbi:MAG: 3-isopropylmalate dehydratase small subunit [Cyanobacteria bacterium P01_H01_bin.74]
MTTQKKISVLTSAAIPLNLNNIDTDQIIPARFLKGTTKTGLGEKLFYDLRYTHSGEPVEGFVLNQPRYQRYQKKNYSSDFPQILVSGHNFGCGSSREHAPWALRDYGIQVILAISFADIFKNNALKNQLLPIALPESVIFDLLSAIEESPDLKITVDLPNQSVQISALSSLDTQTPNASTQFLTQSFTIDPFRKKCLLDGLDDIQYTLTHNDKILAYENSLIKL